MVNAVKLTPTKKPLAMNGFDVSVEFCFEGQDTDERILPFLIVSFQAITETLSTAARNAVELMGLIVPEFHIKQSIVSAIRGTIPQTVRQTYWNCACTGRGLFSLCVYLP